MTRRAVAVLGGIVVALLAAGSGSIQTYGATQRSPMVFAWCGPAGAPTEAHARIVFDAAAEKKAFVENMLADGHLAQIQQALSQGEDVFTTLIAPAKRKKQSKMLAAAGLPDDVETHLQCINVRTSADPIEARTPPQLRDEQGMPGKLRASTTVN